MIKPFDFRAWDKGVPDTASAALGTDPLFIGVFPTGISYADRTRERDGDYVRLAFLPYSTLVLKVEADCPAELRARIEADARRMEMLRGQNYEVSTCGQTVRLGSAG